MSTSYFSLDENVEPTDEELLKEMEDELKQTRSEQEEQYKEWNEDKKKGIYMTPTGKVKRDV